MIQYEANAVPSKQRLFEEQRYGNYCESGLQSLHEEARALALAATHLHARTTGASSPVEPNPGASSEVLLDKVDRMTRT